MLHMVKQTSPSRILHADFLRKMGASSPAPRLKAKNQAKDAVMAPAPKMRR